MSDFVLYIINRKKKENVGKIMFKKKRNKQIIPFKYVDIDTIKKNHLVRHPYKKYIFELFRDILCMQTIVFLSIQ